MAKRNPALEKLHRRVLKSRGLAQKRNLRQGFDILQRKLGFEKTSGEIAEKLRDRLAFNFRTGRAIGTNEMYLPRREINERVKTFAEKHKIPLGVIRSVKSVDGKAKITITPRYAKTLNVDAGTYNIDVLKNTKLGAIFGNEIVAGEKVMKKTTGSFLKEQFKRSAKIKGSAANILMDRYNNDKAFKQRVDDFTNAQRGRYSVWDKKLKKMVMKGQFKARGKVDKILVYIKSRQTTAAEGAGPDGTIVPESPTGDETSSGYEPNPDDYEIGGKYNKF